MNLNQWVETNPIVENWLTNVKPSSARQYGYRFKSFLEVCRMNPGKFLELAQSDKIKTKTMMNRFYNHLIEQKRTDNYAAFSENTIKSFLKFYEIQLKTPKRDRGRTHKRKALRKDKIKKLVDAAPHLRDKALIVMAFQTGMSISDLLALNYGDVKDAIENDKNYHIIEYIRGKKRIESKTVIGRDSINYLKQYLTWRQQLGHKLTTKTPLFTGIKKHRSQNRFSTRSAQDMIRKTVVKAGITTFEELGDFNLYGFHALRKAFSSVSKQNGVPFEQVEMSMGHRLPYNGAYDEWEDKELISNFQEAEPNLSISIDTRDLEEKTKETKDELKTLKNENDQLKERLVKIEQLLEKLAPTL